MARSAAAPAAIAALLALVHAHSAHALNTKSWVSNAGSDANDCSRAHPCATFQRAHDQTSPGGEIGVFTPGDFGGSLAPRLTITQSINITNDGTGEATVLGPAGDVAILVEPDKGDVVSLRGLVIDGLRAGVVGIVFQDGAALHVQNCVIRNFEATDANGIFFVPSPPVPETQLFVSDSILYNNGSNPGSGAIIISTQSAGNSKTVLDRVHVENSVEGLLIDGRLNSTVAARVIVRDSVFSGNAANGIHALTQAGGGAALAVVERTAMVNNRQNGIFADGPHATVLLNDSTVARNGVGITTVNTGQLISYRNNRINNNIGPDGAPTSFLSLN